MHRKMLLSRTKFAVRDNFSLDMVSSLAEWVWEAKNSCSELYFIILFNGLGRQLAPVEQKGKIIKTLGVSCHTKRERRKGQGAESVFKNSM